MIDRDAEEALTFPAVSVSVALMLQIPSAKVPNVHVLPVEIVHKTSIDPAFVAVTVPRATPDTFIFGVLSLVKLSVLETPISDVASRSGVAGAATVVLLITTLGSAVPASELTPPPD